MVAHLTNVHRGLMLPPVPNTTPMTDSEARIANLTQYIEGLTRLLTKYNAMARGEMPCPINVSRAQCATRVQSIQQDIRVQKALIRRWRNK